MSLRGGGGVCKSETHIQQTYELDYHQIVKEITNRCEVIRALSQNINKSQESLVSIDKEILWFIRSNQIIHDLLHQNEQLNKNNKVSLLRYPGLMKKNLIIILEAIKNLIDSSIYVVQLLNICNLFSRLILRIQRNTIQIVDQDNEIINFHLDYINSFIQFRNYQFKGINQYHISLIRMCSQGCSIQFGQNVEPLNQIVQQLDDFANNTVQFFSHNTSQVFNKKQISIKEELILFYIEEIISILIQKYQNGAEITLIKSNLNQVYVEFVLQSDQWTTKLSWAKIICELISYQPYISQTNYNQLLIQHKLALNWEQAINQKLIIPVDQPSQYGLIQYDNTNLNWEIFNQKLITLEQLKFCLLEGYQSIPRLDDYIYQSEEMNNEYQREYIINKKKQFYYFVDCLPIDQIQTNYQNFSIKLKNCNTVFQGLFSGKINIGHQIKQFQKFSSQLFNDYKQLDYNTQILDLQLQNICRSDQQNVINQQSNKYFFYCIFQQLLSVYKECNSVHNFNIPLNELINLISNLNIDIISNNTDEIKVIQSQINDQNCSIDQILSFIENQTKYFYVDEQFNTNIYLRLVILIQKQIQYVFDKELRQLFQYYELVEIIEKSKYDELKNKLQQIIFTSYYYFSFKQHSYQLIRKLIKQYKVINPVSFSVRLNELLKINLKQTSLEFQEFTIKKKIVSDLYSQIRGQSNFDKVLQQIQILGYFDLLSLKIKEQFEIKKSQIISQINLISENPKDFKLKEIQLKLQLMQNLEKLRNLFDNQQDKTQIQLLLKQRIDLISSYLAEINENEQLEQLLQGEIDQYLIYLHQKQSKYFFQQMIHQISDNQQIIQIIVQNQNQQINQFILDYYQKIVQILESQLNIIELQQIQLQECSLKALKQYQNIYLNNQINDELYLEVCKIFKSSFDLKVQNLDFFFQSLNRKIELEMDLIDNQQLILIKQSMIQSLFPFNISMDLNHGIELENRARSFKADQLWRIREYSFQQLLYTFNITEQKIQERMGSIIILGMFNETDNRIYEIFHTNHINRLFLQLNINWDEMKNILYQKFQTSLVFLKRLQNNLQVDTDEQKLHTIQSYQKQQQMLDQKLRNIHYLEQLYKIDFTFLHDVQRNLQTFKIELNQYMNASEQMQKHFFQFKLISPQQLIETYLKNVLQSQEIWNFQNFLVQQSVAIFNYNIQSEEIEKSHLFSFQNKIGEIQKFLNERNLSILLINGSQGSGKTLMAKQIEEYISKEYFVKVNNQKWETINQQIFIPIFIQAPKKQNPQGLIEQTLKRHYKFDHNQIDQLRQVIQNTDKINLVFIIEDYIQLGKQIKQTNLIQAININQWKFQNQQQNPKLIITQTCEIFQKLDDVKQLCHQYSGFQNILQVRLLPFYEFKREEFIQQYCWHQVKLQVMNLFDMIGYGQQNQTTILNIYQQIKDICNITIKSKYLLENVQQQQVISIIKSDAYLQNIKKVQEEYFLKQVYKIWCHHQYIQVIVSLNQQHLLKIPFMFYIILQTLPQIQDNDSFNIQKKSYDFYQIYLKNKLEEQQFINQQQNQNQVVREQAIQQNNQNPEQLIDQKKQRLVKLQNLKDYLSQEEENLKLEIQQITQEHLHAQGQIPVQQNIENTSYIYQQDLLNFNDHMQFDWDGYISTCQISQNKQFLVIGGFEKRLQIYDLDTKENVYSVDLENIVKISKFTPDTKYLVFGDEQGYLYRYQLQNEFKEMYKERIHQSQISDLILADNDSALTCSYDKSIILTNISQNKQLLKIQNVHTDQIRGVDYHQQKSLIASCSDDKSIKLFDSKTGQFLFQKENAHTLYIQQVQFIPNDQLISSNINDLFLWQMDHSQKQLTVIKQIEQKNYNVSSILNNQKVCVVCEKSIKLYDDQLKLIQEIGHKITDFLYYSRLRQLNSLKYLIIPGRSSLQVMMKQ